MVPKRNSLADLAPTQCCMLIATTVVGALLPLAESLCTRAARRATMIKAATSAKGARTRSSATRESPQQPPPCAMHRPRAPIAACWGAPAAPLPDLHDRAARPSTLQRSPERR